MRRPPLFPRQPQRKSGRWESFCHRSAGCDSNPQRGSGRSGVISRVGHVRPLRNCRGDACVAHHSFHGGPQRKSGRWKSFRHRSAGRDSYPQRGSRRSGVISRVGHVRPLRNLGATHASPTTLSTAAAAEKWAMEKFSSPKCWTRFVSATRIAARRRYNFRSAGERDRLPHRFKYRNTARIRRDAGAGERRRLRSCACNLCSSRGAPR